MATHPPVQDDSLLGEAPLERARGLAALAFGSFTQSVDLTQARHLALLPTESLELDLNDPEQRQFGDYELLELLGEGGMGVVYRARQKSLDREVAVKLLSAGPWASKDFVARFAREAQNAARMQHPAIVTVYEVGNFDGLQFFSMRLVQGESLSARLKRGEQFTPREAAVLIRTVAEAVGYAHSLGVLHLDLKPANVLLDEAGQPYVADFGLARRLENALAVDNNEVSGTPAYMAPEQAEVRAHKLSAATDIWGLGAILYELLTGHPPFRGESAQETVQLVLEGQVRAPRRFRPSLPLDLEAIVLHCLSRDPRERYPTARALADDLACFVEGRPVQARPLNVAQRMLRWARREPKLAVSLVCIVLALVIGLVATNLQWRQAQSNAITASKRLWQNRRDTALQLQQTGNGFAALHQLVANIDEQRLAGKDGPGSIERREIGAILSQGAVLVNRVHLPGAAAAAPFAAELSPDGRRFAVAMTDQTVHWYATDTMKDLGHVDLLGLPDSTDQPEQPVLLRFVDNERLIVTLDWFDFYAKPVDSDSYLIDLDTRSLVPFPADFADLASAAFSADGKYAVLSNRHNQIQVWQVEPWKPLSPLVERGRDREMIVLGRHGQELFGIGNFNRTLIFYDPRTLAQTARIQLPQTEGLTAWAQSHDGRRYAFGDAEGRLYVLDMASKSLRQLPTPSGREVTWIAFSGDDAWLAAVRRDGAAYAFDLATGDPVNAGQMQHDFELTRVAISHRQHLLIASGLGKSAMWRLPDPGPTTVPATRIATSPLRPAVAGPYSLGFCAATGMLVSAETDGEIRLWRAPASPVLDARAARLLPGMLEYDGVHVVDVAYDKLRVLAPDTGAATPWVRMPQPLAFAGLIDRGHTLVAVAGTRLSVFDATTMRPRFAPVDLGDSPMRLAASAASEVIAVSFPAKAARGFAERIESFDLRSGEQLAAPVTVTGPLRQFQLSRDGKRLLLAAAHAPTLVLDAHTLKRVGAFTPAAGSWMVWAAFGSRDDDDLWLLTRPDDERVLGGKVIQWNAGGNRIMATHTLSGTSPVGIAVVAGQPFVAGNGFDVFDAGEADARHIDTPMHAEATAAIAVSHDGRLIAHAFRYGVQLYDARNGERIGLPLHADLRASVDLIAQLAFSPDDRQLLARTLRGAWVRWPIVTDTQPAKAIQRDADLLDAAPGEPVLTGAALAMPQRDPGPWQQPAVRPQPPSARMLKDTAIPARPDGTNPLLLDLTDAYTTAPQSTLSLLHALIPNMDGLPLGVVRIHGTDFDVRGTIQLQRTKDALASDTETDASGIRVPAEPIAAFHVLMLAGIFSPLPRGMEQARLIIHYRDGGSADVPLRSGDELPADPNGAEPVPLGWAWAGGLQLRGYAVQHLLDDPRLPNPYPDRLIASIDLIDSSPVESNPAIFAITAEPVIAAAKSRTHHQQGVEKPPVGAGRG